MGPTLEDGARVGIIGGGPAGALFAYFLLTFARRSDLRLDVDIYEPREFSSAGPAGCNMCGGIVSESLVQLLATEGINLPATVVQRGIDSYILHADHGSVRIETPLHERRIAAVHRGGGPRDLCGTRWASLDGHLLGLAKELGARHVPLRVPDVAWDGGRPQVRLPQGNETYDLLVGATGVNTSGWQLFERLGLLSRRFTTTAAYVTELGLGEHDITRCFGNSMHVFLLNIPRLDFAAIIPKGDYLTVCLLGDDIDKEVVGAFFESAPVRRCFPPTWHTGAGACHCSPKLNILEARGVFADRVVMIGDCGVTRLYKDGIGAAYRTAKAAARTAVFSGISGDDFERHYGPLYRSIAMDNRFGRLMFTVVQHIRILGPLIEGVTRMCRQEQARPGAARRMSAVLWDMFSGSAPYREIFWRTLDPRFLTRFAWESALAVGVGDPGSGPGGGHA